VIPFLKNLLKFGKKIAVVTNQQGIAKGLYSIKDVQDMHEIVVNSVDIGKEDFPIYICPHLIGTCSCRKPHPKLINQAIAEANQNLIQTVYIGDQLSDYEAAQNAGIQFIYLNRSKKDVFSGDFLTVSSLSEISFDMLNK